MNKEISPLELEYEKQREKCASLGASLKESLTALLAEKDIKHLGIQLRIKSIESFFRKAENKQYTDPINETEDICGLRIICYYQSDFLEVCKILEREFDVINFVDKEKELDVDRFGYRSKHYVVTVKKDWLAIPNYRALGDLKAEIQVRTILMHSWAEIEHKLNYKSEDAIPNPLKRKLYRLSALIEMADEQFEQIRNERRDYITTITPKSGEQFDLSQEINIDTLQAFLDAYLPEREKSKNATTDLLKELLDLDISFEEILKSYRKGKEFLAEASRIQRNIPKDKWTQVGAIRLSLELTNEGYFNYRRKKYPSFVIQPEFIELRKRVNEAL